MRVQGFLIYRIWYGNCLVYVGRTKQPLQSRIRGHLFNMRMASTLRNTPRCGLRHRDGCPVSLTSRRL